LEFTQAKLKHFFKGLKWSDLCYLSVFQLVYHP